MADFNERRIIFQGYDPVEESHPVFSNPDAFLCVRFDISPFECDPNGEVLVPACLHAIFRNIHRAHVQTLESPEAHSFTCSIRESNCLYRRFPLHHIARFLLFQVRSVEDAFSILDNRDPFYLFFLLRDILEVTQPPMLYLDYETCVFMDSTNILFPMGEPPGAYNGIYPPDYFHNNEYLETVVGPGYLRLQAEKVAYLNCYVFTSLMTIPNIFHRNVTRYIFFHLCNLVRACAIANSRGNLTINDYRYCLDHALFCRKVAYSIRNVANFLADKLICLDPTWANLKALFLRRTFPSEEFLRNLEYKLKNRAMMNILASNIPCLFLRGTTFDDFKFDDISTSVVNCFKDYVAERIIRPPRRYRRVTQDSP